LSAHMTHSVVKGGSAKRFSWDIPELVENRRYRKAYQARVSFCNTGTGIRVNPRVEP
jgi:hypothetical protein